jgi:hypothetical protein
MAVKSNTGTAAAPELWSLLAAVGDHCLGRQWPLTRILLILFALSLV